jgi:hypothetical protein
MESCFRDSGEVTEPLEKCEQAVSSDTVWPLLELQIRNQHVNIRELLALGNIPVDALMLIMHSVLLVHSTLQTCKSEVSTRLVAIQDPRAN